MMQRLACYIAIVILLLVFFESSESIFCSCNKHCPVGSACLGDDNGLKNCYTCNCTLRTQCSMLNDMVSCDCSESGFTGVNCETEIDECDPEPCLNDGTCIDGINSYACQCVLGYFGFNCSVTGSVVNLALGKPSSQPSIKNGQTQWDADKGNDGDRNGVMANNHCFHLDIMFEPWWQVDLLAVYTIIRVDLYNRLDCCTSRARNIEIRTATEAGNWSVAAYQAGTMGNSLSLPINAVPARYVEVRLSSITENFHLCEVEVYGYDDKI